MVLVTKGSIITVYANRYINNFKIKLINTQLQWFCCIKMSSHTSHRSSEFKLGRGNEDIHKDYNLPINIWAYVSHALSRP